MSPIVKDSETLETSETSVRPGSAALNDSATKPQPVALEVPIMVNGARTVEGSDKREPFSEATKTVMVHGNGAVIKLNSALAPGQLLFLTNERTKKEVVCQVLKSKNYRSVSGYIELEFTEPAVGFWGMRFPGDRIGPGPQAAPEPSRPAASHGSPAPSQPAEKAEPRGADSASGGLRAKPSTAVPVLSKPATPALSGSSIVPAPIDSGSLLGTPKANPDSGVPAAPLAPSFGSEEALVEPWLKKREPASRVPAEPPGVARPEPAKRTEAPAPSQPPVRNFELAHPSDKPASLFAPSEPPSNPATVDLSSLAPFFAVKPAPSDLAPAAPPQAPESSDPEAEELKRQTARLQEELSRLGFAEKAPGMPAAPTLDAPPAPVVEPAISLLKVDPIHDSAAELIENPTSPGAVLPEAPKLEEPWKVEPPAPIPALDSLEEAELEIPAWLRPLARNASLPPPANEPVPRERAKRVREQPQLEELMAPLAAPSKDANAAGACGGDCSRGRRRVVVQKSAVGQGSCRDFRSESAGAFRDVKGYPDEFGEGGSARGDVARPQRLRDASGEPGSKQRECARKRGSGKRDGRRRRAARDGSIRGKEACSWRGASRGAQAFREADGAEQCGTGLERRTLRGRCHRPGSTTGSFGETAGRAGSSGAGRRAGKAGEVALLCAARVSGNGKGPARFRRGHH